MSEYSGKRVVGGFDASKQVVVFAGPCAIESEEQFEQVCACVASLGLHWVRGGAFKPRTNPHSFQGLGLRGLQIMNRVANKHRLLTLSEVIDAEHIDVVDEYSDGLQIGARNMTNYSLLKTIGEKTAQTKKLVFFKRGMAATVSEWLSAAEYITSSGNDNVVLCERGLRTFETATRYTLDISAVPVVQKQSVLPICVDVSHPAGQADLVPALACAALASGADAIMIEVHPHPQTALSDGPQQLNLEQFASLIGRLRTLAAAMGKEIV
ncbi:MAG: 3-deoxy-7-phosphoheptulonate synthase [Eggerthellaceae bacterium]|nr:3-deoxy-7-phosphoheptulonate synthase [Eggerthellaceae bacterium]